MMTSPQSPQSLFSFIPLKILLTLASVPSCLENPRNRGAWWAAVSGVAHSRTQLKRLSSSSSLCLEIPCLMPPFFPTPQNSAVVQSQRMFLPPSTSTPFPHFSCIYSICHIAVICSFFSFLWTRP